VHVTPAPYLASLGLSVIGGSLFNMMCGFLVRDWAMEVLAGRVIEREGC
jgi:hypothetical protein